MTDRQPMRVQITYDRTKRGRFILNGMDITHSVNSCSVELIALKVAKVTFTVHVDELEADVEGEVMQA